MSSLESADRETLARLADVLIPPAAGSVAAGDADVAGAGVDAVLAARPDLLAPLLAVVRAAGDRHPASVVRDLRSGDPAAFAVLAETVAAAYFMNERVRAAIGYDGQSARPIDPHPDHLDDGLLDSVLSRGPIYRPTPGRG